MRTSCRATITLSAALIVAACSTVEPVRVTSTNDAHAVGLRYYETRPFLVVRKPYPIASEPFLVHGVLGSDGKTFVIRDAPPELKMPVRTELQISKPLAPQQGNRPGDGRDGKPPSNANAAGPSAGAQADTEVGRDSKAAKDAGGESDAGKGEGPPPEASDTACQKGAQSSTTEAHGTTHEAGEIECSDTSGQRLAFSSISLETDLTGTAIVPVNELFSIVYLPDYDREFYIKSRARWGMSRLHVTRGPGGTLLAYNAEVDNSAVVKPLSDAWNTLVSAATKAAVVKIEPKAQAQLVESTETVTLLPQGTPATLRIHRVKFAVPGVYPFIKPQETAVWKAATDAERARMLVPSLPYQIPYDYFTVLIAEQLLDPPGTSGLLTDVSAAREEGDKSGGKNGGGGGPPFECLRDGLPSGDFSPASANLVLQSDEALRGLISDVTSAEKDANGCAVKLTVKVKDGTKAERVKEKLQGRFPKAEFDVQP
jgi:hypothetical protein